jgi:hypothetical protein
MPKIPGLVLSATVAAGIALLAQTGEARQPAAASITAASEQGWRVLPVQYGPGSGTGTGGGYGVRCRMVPGVPGSGMGPQRVCERVPRCRTVVIPGSGLGPQRVCD